MNKAVTDGLVLMPPPFSAGLNLWSQTNGRPGSPTYDQAAFAAFVPSDPDFGGALEIQKVSALQRLRWMGDVPILPGCYLRITARVKAIAGALPSVRIAGNGVDGAGNLLSGLPTNGAEVALTSYGEVVTISAIVGTGARGGVDMAWGTAPVIGHFGLDLSGPTGGVVRIDDITIEDVSAFWNTDAIGFVDVRDFGAVGNGVSDDRPAFVAAIAAAQGRSLLVPAGSYFIGSDLTVTIPALFRGSLVMPDNAILILQGNYDFPSYEAAMGGGEAGFRKGLQALFHTNQHVTFDLKGRRAPVSAPVDVFALAGLDGFVSRRVLANGQINVTGEANWTTQTVTRVASYSTANPFLLSGVNNVAGVPVGARVQGVGVGREVYVRARNIGAGTLTLSQPLFGGSGTQNFTFLRYRYALDFSGFSGLRDFEFDNLEFLCKGRASAVMLPEDGSIIRFNDCIISRPRDRGITSIGRACQGLLIDHCQFLSSQMPTNAQDRDVIAFNVNGNDAKIRNNRAVLWAHFGVLAGTGHVITGNHFFGGDNEPQGLRQAGLVLTNLNLKTTITGNYIDNSFIELTNEYDPDPAFTGGFSYGGLTITGNIFTCNDVAPWFSWIVVKPYGPGQFLQGLLVVGNVFRTIAGRIDKIDKVDTTYGTLDYGRFRNVRVTNNAFNGIDYPVESPTVVIHDQTSEASTWTIGSGDKLPFSGWARTVASVVMENPARDASNVIRHEMPYVQVQQGANNDRVRLNWPQATRGRAIVTMQVDRPL